MYTICPIYARFGAKRIVSPAAAAAGFVINNNVQVLVLSILGVHILFVGGDGDLFPSAIFFIRGF